jgi:hypothetical protein
MMVVGRTEDMEWREPQDDFGLRLIGAWDAVLTAPHDPRCLSAIEGILMELYQHYDQARVDRLGWMADELDRRLGQTSVVASVAAFVERLRELVFSPSPHSANVGEMLVWAREILAQGTGRPAAR